jgi:2-isopropylmalate synthase
MKNQVKIFDTTLRDGEQAPGNSMNLQEKVRLAKQLERLGVDVIEAGFPIASPEDFAAVNAIAKVCQTVEVCGLARALKKDIDATWEAIKPAKKPRIHTFIATSPIHMEHKLGKSEDEVLKMAIDAVTYAKSLCDRVDFSPEDAVRSEPEFLYKVIEAVIKAGADTINIPDTVGYSTPEEFGALIKGIIENVPNIEGVILSTHCHNDLGMAVANSLAGVKNGARQIECTINGIGERAGNAALEEVVMALKTRPDFFDLTTNIKTEEIYKSSQLLTSITGVPVQPNKAIVGANAFAHESGIHQHGVLKNRQTYEIMTPQDIGLDANKLVLGKHSGRAALKDRLESLGYFIEQEQLNEMFVEFKTLADKKKEVFDEDLFLLMSEQDNKEDPWQISSVDVRCGTEVPPHAWVSIIGGDGTEYTAKAQGSGPVDAAYGAINKIVRGQYKLTEYAMKAVTEGIDAQAIVAVQIESEGRTYSASAGATDIVVASAKAYLSALSRARIYQDMKKDRSENINPTNNGI